ncbi:uncharacterized protein LOC143919261 [Arctopsyche grandis]|uniref:uncharacterized protein LOC143919261 n=1 Tax=Arctopsyche grandis TaxID=121162 RepID=UPI00406D758F
MPVELSRLAFAARSSASVVYPRTTPRYATRALLLVLALASSLAVSQSANVGVDVDVDVDVDAESPPPEYVLMVDNAWKNIIEETQVVVTRGAPLSLPCKAPDPRAALQARREYSNVLDISKNYGQPASVYESRIDYDNQRSQKAEKNTDFANRRNPYHSLPIDDDDDDEQIDNANEDDTSGQMENGELYANDDVSDSNTSDFVKRKNGSNKRKLNKKLDKKQLDSDSKRILKTFQAKSIEDIVDLRVTYRWFHNDTELPVNDTRYSISENGTLHFKRFGFKKIGNQDIGKYRCIAVGANGSMISTAVSLAFASMDRNFSYYPTNTEVNEGDAMQLMCSIKSVPRANIVWEKNRSILSNDRRYYTFPSGSLLIINANLNDAGEYRCIATNNILNKTKYSSVATVSVLQSALKSYNLEFVNIKDFVEPYNNITSSHIIPAFSVYRSNISLGCAVKGRPKPKVVWNFKSDDEETEDKEISSMEILRLNDVTEDKSGIYTCVAENEKQKIQQVYNLTVLRTPFLKQTPTSEYTPAAKTVRFNCSAGGNPTPKVLWYKDGKPLTISGRVKFKVSEKRPPVLIISDTVSSDKGVYQCIASNELGEAAAWGALSVRSPMFVEPPVTVHCIPLTSTSIRLIWDAPKDLEVVAYTVHYTSDGVEESKLQSNIEFVLEFDTPYKQFEFYTKTYTKSEASDQSSHVTCHGQGVPMMLQSNNNSITIHWENSPYVKQWQVQWRLINDENNIFNRTLSENITTYSTNMTSMDKYEFRVLASPTELWLDQDLSFIRWISMNSNLSNFNSYADVGKGNSTNKNAQNQFDQDIFTWSALKPTDVIATSTTSRAINITWKCDAAEKNLNGFVFIVCYSKYDGSPVENRNFKLKGKCNESFNNWIEILGLEPDTLYALRVQAVMQNHLKSGSFSETILCRTRNNISSSVTNIRWAFMDEGIVNISWSPNTNLFIHKDEQDDSVDQEDEVQKIYTVYYSHNHLAPLAEWKAKNVTNSTQIELKNLHVDLNYYVMVSIWGEEGGAVISIPPREALNSSLQNITPESSSDFNTTNDQQFGIILGVILSVTIVLICGTVIGIQRHKNRQNSRNAQGPQVRTNRIGGTDFECKELVSPPTNFDSKTVVYMNGVSNDSREHGAGKPLLNGHVHITENPRFSSKRHLPNGTCGQLARKINCNPVFAGALDVSRYDELPDVTIETILENDTSLMNTNCTGDDVDSNQILSIQSPTVLKLNKNGIHSENSNNDCKVSTPIAVTMVGSNAIQVDRNSNSEVSIVNRIKEAFNNENVESCEPSLFNSNKMRIPGETLEKKTERELSVNYSKLENMKNNHPLDAATALDYRENGNSRRITPALGPNG